MYFGRLQHADPDFNYLARDYPYYLDMRNLPFLSASRGVHSGVVDAGGSCLAPKLCMSSWT